jgi:glycosyltransferase involved in cell wall biosynthesis
MRSSITDGPSARKPAHASSWAGRTHILIALENEPYPYDRRVRQEAEAFVAAGHDVTVVGPTGFGFDALEERVDGVLALRYEAPPGGRGVLGYAREYGLSLLHLTRLMWKAHRRRPVDVALVCNPPDLLVLPALMLRRAGAAVIFDHHDLSPELFALKFGDRRWLQRIVRKVESFALRSADTVIATNDTYAEVDRRRGPVEPHRVHIVRNGPDPKRIYPVKPRPELRRGREKLVCWVGLMSDQEGLHHLLDAADELVKRRGREDVAFAIVGAGDARDSLMADTARRGLGDYVDFPGRADDELLRAYMSTADVCVGVDESNPMNDSSTMTKVIEYMVMGRPIVQFPLHETSRVCGDTSLYARTGDSLDLAERIAELLDDPERAERLGAAARKRAVPALLWPEQVPALLHAVGAALDLRGAAAR